MGDDTILQPVNQSAPSAGNICREWNANVEIWTHSFRLRAGCVRPVDLWIGRSEFRFLLACEKLYNVIIAQACVCVFSREPPGRHLFSRICTPTSSFHTTWRAAKTIEHNLSVRCAMFHVFAADNAESVRGKVAMQIEPRDRCVAASSP